MKALARLLRSLDRFWYMPAPAERLALLRILVGSYALIYLMIRCFSLASVLRFDASAFEPVGPVRVLEAPLAAWLVELSIVLALLSALAFVAGFRYAVTGPLCALSFLWVTSYRSSWGMIFHTENVVSLHLVLLALAPAAEVLSFDARGRDVTRLVASGRYGWAIRAVSTVTVVTYVLAGVAKLRLSGAEWIGGDVLRAQVAYDNLRKIELGSLHSPLGAWLVGFAWPFRGLALMSLALELGAPLALLGGRVALLWVLGAFSFHLGVVALMAIGFPYQLSLVAYASFFPLERALRWPVLQRLRLRLTRT